jgi:hypothetical protein
MATAEAASATPAPSSGDETKKRVVIITGGNTGIGLETAKALVSISSCHHITGTNQYWCPNV